MLANRHAPLLTLGNPPFDGLDQPGKRAGARGGNAQATSVQRSERNLQAHARLANNVLGRHLHVGESDKAIAQAAQTHEAATVNDFNAGGIRLDHERRNLLDLFAVLHQRRGLRHHHHQLGIGTIRTPQLRTVHQVIGAVFRRNGGGAHLRRVRAHVRLGQSKRADRASGQARQELLLLLGCSEQLQRLRHADGLVRGYIGYRGLAVAAHETQQTRIVPLRKAQATVVLGNLHAEDANRRKAIKRFLRENTVFVQLNRVVKFHHFTHLGD